MQRGAFHCAMYVCLAGSLVFAGSGRPQTEGTRRMAALLAELNARNDADPNVFSNTERLQALLALPPPSDPVARSRHELRIAMEMLYSRRTTESVARLKQLSEQVNDPFLREQLAVGYLRLGEEHNCIRHHGTESCLLPIRGPGIHTEQSGSRAAISEYAAILAQNPDDLAARWLMNIAYMTVGEYPDGVPKTSLIPPRVFDSDHEIGKFGDVAQKRGVDVNGRAGGAILDDFDGDGHLDLFLTSMGMHDSITFLHNRGDGTFEDRSAA